jgi:hypothetical protein
MAMTPGNGLPSVLTDRGLLDQDRPESGLPGQVRRGEVALGMGVASVGQGAPEDRKV